MNKVNKIFYLFVITSAFVSSVVMSAPVDINITGRVIASACTVNPQLVNSQNVDLGTLGRTQIQAVGQASEWKSFTLTLSNCPVSTTKITATFIGTPDSTDATLFANIEPTTTAATNIAIQMVDDNNHSNVISNNSTMTVNVDAGTQSAIFPLAARLYTTNGGVQAGAVNSIVLVNFTYQ